MRHDLVYRFCVGTSRLIPSILDFSPSDGPLLSFRQGTPRHATWSAGKQRNAV